ncbi:MAG: hypothetical protein ACYC6H_02310 [Bellilinea sp.]
MDNPLAKKLLIRPANHVLVRNPPPDFLIKLQPLPEGAKVSTDGEGLFDVVLQFVYNKTEVDAQALDALRRARNQGVVWMIYPKRSKTVQTDINRDSGWDVLWDAGWVGIGIVAIDEAWAGLRFRLASQVKRKPDSIFLK